MSDPAPGGVLATIAADPGLAALLAEARVRDAALAVPDPTHDVAHLLRVAHWTLRLGGDAIDPREGVAAALLHDAVHVPKNSPERARASELAAAHAAERLPALGFAPVVQRHRYERIDARVPAPAQLPRHQGAQHAPRREFAAVLQRAHQRVHGEPVGEGRDGPVAGPLRREAGRTG